MKKVIGTMLFMFAVMVFSSIVLAQPGGQGPGGPGGPGGRDRPRTPGGDFAPGTGIELLIRNAETFGLSEEQVGKLNKLSEELRPRRTDRPQGGGDRPQGSGPPSREEIQKFREEIEKRLDEGLAKINRILTPEQQEKLKTWQFQVSGGLDSPFLSIRNLEVLNLTDEQKEKLKALNEERVAESRAALEKRGPVDWRRLSPEDREKIGAELQAENDARTKKFVDQIKTILTPEQKEKVEKLTAEAKELREKLGIGNRDRRDGGDRPERERGEYRPDQDSWRPGQGTGERRNQNRQQRRAFPQSE
ncbi:MAG: Spy/CpxP family protein refolding chaperone [Planctomycetaceae bacterium]|jgi:Spy/CpxP family protein refolding chaperone|nr:Spy/CpxP family protein refolding chaperone [Planctomycetaceae bacterium]